MNNSVGQKQKTIPWDNIALKSDIPNVSGFATSGDVSTAKSEAISEAAAAAAGLYQPKGSYALKSEIPSVSGLASETWVQNYISGLNASEVSY